jgi:type IV secretory pathway VirB9-like protein
MNKMSEIPSTPEELLEELSPNPKVSSVIKLKWMLPLVGTTIMKIEVQDDGTVFYYRSTRIVPYPEDRKIFDTHAEALKAVRENLLQLVNNAYFNYKQLDAKLEEFDKINEELLKEIL